MRHLILLFWALFFNGILHAQVNEFRFEQLKEGLSQSNVTCILEDRYGFMWFGTKNGLNRYDGYSFEIYEHDASNPQSISENWVTSILEVENGDIWVATYGGGVSVFHRDTNTFTQYMKEEGNEHSLSNNIAVHLYKDHQGDIWVGTQHGLNKFRPSTQDFERFTAENSGMIDDQISVVFEDKQNQLWVGTTSIGIMQIDPKNHSSKHYSYNPNNPNSIAEDNVRTAYKDRNGDVWLGFNAKGMQRLIQTPGEELRFETYQHDPSKPKSLSSNTVLSIYEDNAGKFWVGTENGGLALMDRKSGTFRHFESDPTDSYSIGNNSIWSIGESTGGILWFGTFDQGLSKLDKRFHKFTHIRRNNNDPHSLNHNTVSHFEEDDKGNIWIATDGGGLNYYHPATGYVSHIKNIPADTNSLGSNAITNLFRDSHDRLWATTWGGGISILQNINEPKNKFQVFSRANHYFDAIEDHEGNIWVVGWGGGLTQYGADLKVKASFMYSVEDPTPPISSGNMFCLQRDHRNWLWAGSLNGLNIGKQQQDGSWKFEQLFHDSNDPKSLSNSVILIVFRDSKDNIWVGTNDGLCLYNEATHDFRRFGQKEGLPSGAIKSMEEDDNGNYWISTNKGLCMMNAQTYEVRVYTPNDGLQDYEFGRASSFKAKSGSLYFGGSQGFNVFSPEKIANNPKLPSVYITGFKIFNKPIPIGEPDSPLAKDIMLTKELTLSHEHSVFSLDFVGINYTHSESNQYAFKLDGLEKDWNYVGSQRTASYSNLDDGVYTFMVKASNNDGVWQDTPTTLTITVLPPWWDTFLFKAFMAIIVIIATVFIYRSRVRRLKLQKEKLEKLVHQRTSELEGANHALHQQKEEITVQNEELMQQSEEIAAQRDQIQLQHKELSDSYKDMNLVTTIGMEVTASLSLERLVETVYEHINTLIDAKTFALGIHNELEETLDFMGLDNNNHELSYGSDLLTDTNNLSVQCFTSQKPIVINDFKKQQKELGVKPRMLGDSIMQSLIYLPLISKGKCLGVMTIQSPNKKAYSERNQTIIQALAAYIITALDNTQAYDIIKTKNTQITDSIRYAQTIQQAILPPVDRFEDTFKEFFILFKPKDIVSGDFYWFLNLEENGVLQYYVAAVDCTGHGVPGAFMSMVGSRILNEIVLEKSQRTPADILSLLDESLRVALRQDEDGPNANTDGMDIGVVRLDYHRDGSVAGVFAGAKNNLWLVQDGELKEIKGDKIYIGGHQLNQDNKSFTNHAFSLKEGEVLYLLTDGFADQNNVSRRKIGSLKLKETLKEYCKMPLATQKEILLSLLESHQGDAKQRDDITVLGIKPL